LLFLDLDLDLDLLFLHFGLLFLDLDLHFLRTPPSRFMLYALSPLSPLSLSLPLSW
jgi:hypothetical protein